MDNKMLAELLFPQIDRTTDYYEKMYPERDIKDGAQVTRLAPSPTGFIHLGNLFGAITDERIAHQSGGIFYLRIEDTDEKRKVDGAVEAILENLSYFGLSFDEGAEINSSTNAYAPYYQRQRAEIYQTYVKELVERGEAYPCFCTEEELTAVREKQNENKENPGYYGKYAKCRELSLDEIKDNLSQKKPYVIRIKAKGDGIGKFIFNDSIKGEITVLENDQDVVILKQDGIPTYHFAHVIDDHLMHTTLVVRGEEWLASLPIHLQLFDILGFKCPAYAHTAQLMKLEDGKKRKLSKRKDPELSLSFYRQLGYHPLVVKTYLLTLLNSNFEEWFLANPDKSIDEFEFSIDKMGQSGALFDTVKLDDVAKTVISRMDVEEVLAFFREWCAANKPELISVMFADEPVMQEIIALGMAIGSKKRRKDFVCASQMAELFSYYFDELFIPAARDEYSCPESLAILTQYLEKYDCSDDSEVWFNKIKEIAADNGFAVKLGDYKKNPEGYKGYVGDVAEIIRIAVTGRKNTPDLYSIMKIVGASSVRERLAGAIDILKQTQI